MIPIYLAALAAWTIWVALLVHVTRPKENEQMMLASHTSEASLLNHFFPPSSPVPSAPCWDPCHVCSSSALLHCSLCSVIKYCSPECETIHWKQGHREECCPLPATHERNDTGDYPNQTISDSPGPSRETGSLESSDGNSSDVITLQCDPDLLTCPYCFHDLSIPVYQCKNGHVMCSNCSSTVGEICPTCKTQGKHCRCIGIEKILESSKSPCPNKKYGCKMIIPWIDRCSHESVCLFLPCFCPISHCDFVGTPLQLSAHVRRQHSNVVRFSHGQSFCTSVSPDRRFQVFLEEKKGNVFVLQNIIRVDGNALSIIAIDQKNTGERFFYKLKIRHGGSTQSLKLHADVVQRFEVADHVPSRLLIAPHSYFNNLDEIELKIHIGATYK